MRVLWIVIAAVCSNVGLVGCGDDDARGGGGAGGASPSPGGGSPGGGGAAVGGAPSDGGGGRAAEPLACDPLQARLAGTLDGVTIDGSFLPFGTTGEPTIHSDFGDWGALHLQGDGSDGPEVPVTGLIRLPNDGAEPGAWVCAGEGSHVAVGEDWRTMSATFESLSVLGPCPGAPVAGAIDVCLADDTCDAGVESTVEGASFSLLLDAFVVQGLHTIGTTRWDIETDLGSVMGFVAMRLDGIDPASTGQQTTSVQSGYIIVPDGQPDARAVYCAGPGSTVDYEMEGPDPIILGASFTGLSRLGACPADPVSGELQYCQRASD